MPVSRFCLRNVDDELRNELRTSYARVTQRVTRRASSVAPLQTPKVKDLAPSLSNTNKFLFKKERAISNRPILSLRSDTTGETRQRNSLRNSCITRHLHWANKIAPPAFQFLSLAEGRSVDAK